MSLGFEHGIGRYEMAEWTPHHQDKEDSVGLSSES